MKFLFKYMTVTLLAMSMIFSAVTYAAVTDTLSASTMVSTSDVSISFSDPVLSNTQMNWNVGSSGASANEFSVDINNLYPGALSSFESYVTNSGTINGQLDSVVITIPEGQTITPEMMQMLGLNFYFYDANGTELFDFASSATLQTDDRFSQGGETMIRFAYLQTAISNSSIQITVPPTLAGTTAFSKLKVTVGMDADEEGKYTSSNNSGKDDSATESQTVAFEMHFNWSGVVQDDPNPTPTPGPGGDPDPVTSPNPDDETDIEDEIVPQGDVDITDETTPLSEFTPEDEILIVLDDVPLGDLPQTGALLQLQQSASQWLGYAIIAVISLVGAVVSTVTIRKRAKNDKD